MFHSACLSASFTFSPASLSSLISSALVFFFSFFLPLDAAVLGLAVSQAKTASSSASLPSYASC